MNKIIKVTAGLLAVYLLATALCFWKFSSLNPLRTGVGVVRVLCGGESLVQVAAWPGDVYLSRTEEAGLAEIEALLAAKGYYSPEEAARRAGREELPPEAYRFPWRMGGIRTYSHLDGEWSATVTQAGNNGLYVRWRIMYTKLELVAVEALRGGGIPG